MKYTVVFHEEANIEFKETICRYEARQKGSGITFRIAIENKIDHLAEFPELYAEISPGFRQTVLRKYPFVIVFSIFKEESVILVSSIFHTSRNPKNKFRK